MTFPFDIHTHVLPAVAGTAIVNAYPATFSPQPGHWYSVGIHPWHVRRDTWSDDWALLQQAVRHPQVVAVGEAGLDKCSVVPMQVQVAAFSRQARLADEVGKPLVIHMVKAVDELLALRRELRPAVPWVIHGFRGKAQQAAMWVAHGCCLSFGVRYQDEALRTVPLSSLLLETDESPQPVAEVCRRAAAVRGTMTDDLAFGLQENVGRLFFARKSCFFR